jgi:tetratricopeptide (TPR) repeat protein
LLGQVIGLDVSDPVIDSLDSELRQRQLAALLQAILAHKSQEIPMVIVLEDLHWADEASLSVLAQIITGLGRQHILLLAIFRPDWQAPWGHWAHARQLNLQELSAGEQQQILQSLLDAKELPAGLSETILARTGGNPLFIEETLTVLRESEALTYQTETWTLDSEVAAKLLPDKVEQLILTRVQRLSENSRELLQTAVVIGQEFEYALLDAVLSDQVRSRLDQGLDELAARELIYTAAGWLPPQITYTFKHGLIQQIIYSDLLDSFRRRVHRQVAQALKNLHDSQEGQGIEQIAYHAYRGDDRILAITSCLQAAGRAAEVWANHTAMTWYDLVFEKLNTFDQVPPLEAEVEKGCTDDQIKQWTVAALTGKADIQLLIGDYEAAIIGYNEAIAQSKENASFANAFRADLYRKIADAYQEQGEYDTAEQALETGLSIVASDLSLETGKLYVWQGLLAFRRGLLVDGLTACHKGIEIIKETRGVKE